jgi:hypothetical protein
MGLFTKKNNLFKSTMSDLFFEQIILNIDLFGLTLATNENPRIFLWHLGTILYTAVGNIYSIHIFIFLIGL